MNMIPTVGIVVFRNDEVLLVREGENSGHLTGVFNTPAGRIEHNETAIEAAMRELQEETGLVTTIDDLRELPKKYTADIPRKDGTVRRFYHTVFLCKKFRGELETPDDVEPEWVETNKVGEYKLLPNVEDMIVEARKLL